MKELNPNKMTSKGEAKALLTDDMDIKTTYFRITLGNNGDYYPEIIFKDINNEVQTIEVRIATSGGNAPLDVRIAVAELYRALEKNDLNNFPF